MATCWLLLYRGISQWEPKAFGYIVIQAFPTNPLTTPNDRCHLPWETLWVLVAAFVPHDKIAKICHTKLSTRICAASHFHSASAYSLYGHLLCLYGWEWHVEPDCCCTIVCALYHISTFVNCDFWLYFRNLGMIPSSLRYNSIKPFGFHRHMKLCMAGHNSQ